MDFELPEDKIRAVVAHLATLRAEYGDAFAEPELIEPNGAFFPDEFKLEPDSIQQLLERMVGYAPLSDDLDINVGFIQPDGEVSGGGGCGSGACGTGGKAGDHALVRAGDHALVRAIARGGAVETDDGYAALVHVSDVGDPTILTTALARAIGRITLFEVDAELDPRNEGPLSELTAIASGFGTLMLNGACVYKKGCGGMKRHQATHLDVEEIALATALFVRASGKKPGTVKKHLEITQKEHFDAALAWVDAQPTLLKALTERPETLADGVFSFEAPKGFFSRLFAKKEDDFSSMKPKASTLSDDDRRRIAEAKALVDEAFSES